MKGKKSSLHCDTIIVAILSTIVLTINIYSWYPGILFPDTESMLKQAIGIEPVDNWHGGIIPLIWIFPKEIGPVIWLLIQNIFLTAGLGILSQHLIRNGSWIFLLIILTPFIPGLPNLIGQICVDGLIISEIVLALALIIKIKSNKKSKLLFYSLIFIYYMMISTRLNSIFFVCFLLYYTLKIASPNKAIIKSAVIILVLITLNSIILKLNNVKDLSPLGSVKIYNLLSLSNIEQNNLFPGDWTEDESRKLVNECYSFNQWDIAWSGKCYFIYQKLANSGQFYDGTLTKYWVSNVIKNPIGYLSSLDLTYKNIIHFPNSPTLLYNIHDENEWNNYYRQLHGDNNWIKKYVESHVNVKMSLPLLFVSLCALVCLLSTLMKGHSISLIFSISGLIYTLTYFIFNVSSEFRYLAPVGYIGYISFFIFLFELKYNKFNLDKKFRLLGFVLSILVLVISFIPLSIPLHTIKLSVIPNGQSPEIVIKRIATASWPIWWQTVPLPNHVEGNGWDCTSFECSNHGSSDTISFLIKRDINAFKIDYQMTSGGMNLSLVDEIDHASQSAYVVSDESGDNSLIISLPESKQIIPLSHYIKLMSLLITLVLMTYFYIKLVYVRPMKD